MLIAFYIFVIFNACCPLLVVCLVKYSWSIMVVFVWLIVLELIFVDVMITTSDPTLGSGFEIVKAQFRFVVWPKCEALFFQFSDVTATLKNISL